MKSNQSNFLLAACIDCAQGLFDIFRIGTAALDDVGPEDDAANLHHDLLQLGNDFRHVMRQIESGNLPE
jgi:hypothetical protein